MSKSSPLVFWVFFTFSLLSLPQLHAAETADADKKKGPAPIDIYLEKVDKKFDRGALNFMTGWTEIVHQPLRRLRNEDSKNKALKVTEGFGQGLLFAVTDTVGGFVNVVSAPIPQFEIPLPQDGVQVKAITQTR